MPPLLKLSQKELADLVANSSVPMVRQSVQLNPRSVVTKIGDKYKILGAVPIGSVAAGDMSLTEWHEYQKQRGRSNATR